MRGGGARVPTDRRVRGGTHDEGPVRCDRVPSRQILRQSGRARKPGGELLSEREARNGEGSVGRMSGGFDRGDRFEKLQSDLLRAKQVLANLRSQVQVLISQKQRLEKRVAELETGIRNELSRVIDAGSSPANRHISTLNALLKRED